MVKEARTDVGWFFLLDRADLQLFSSLFRGTNFATVALLLFDRLQPTCVSLFVVVQQATACPRSVVMTVYIMTVSSHDSAVVQKRERKIDGLSAAIWNGSCMKARLGTVLSNKVQISRGLPQGAPESPVVFTLIKSWKIRKLAWSLDDFVLAAICYADDVVLVVTSVAAAEVMVAEVIANLIEVGLSVGAQSPEDDG